MHTFLDEALAHIKSSSLIQELRGSRKLQRLVDLLLQNDFDPKEFARKLQVSPAALKQLKSRLEEQVVQYIVVNGTASRYKDSYVHGVQATIKQAYAMRLLIIGSARNAATILGEKLIRATIRYELTDMTISVARDLHYYYTTLSYHPQKQKRYGDILEKHLAIYNREIKAYLYFSEIRNLNITRRGSLEKEAIEKLGHYKNELETFMSQSDLLSDRLLEYIYNINIMFYEAHGEYFNVIKYCDVAISHFHKRQSLRRALFFQLDLYKIAAYIQLREYRQVKKIADKYYLQLAPGTINWCVLRIYLTINLIHSREYLGAKDILIEITNNNKFHSLPSHLIEVCTVYSAYIDFIYKAHLNLNHEIEITFRLNKFLNEVPLYSKDKRGLNMSILTIQFLFLLYYKRYSDLIDRVDALKQYCYRYLRKDDTFRPHCFIRMLIQIPRADFNRIRTERYAEPYVKKLKTVPLRLSEQSIEVEIIPYEDLWEMTLELLD